MRKEQIRAFAVLLLAFLTAAAAGCTMTPEPGNGGLATGIPPTLAALPTNIPVEVTVVAVEQPVAPPPGASTPLPYPPPRPQPTPPYLGPSPYPGRSQIAPSPTPTAAIYPVDDCAAHPGFTRCGGAPLTGKLAYFSPDDQLTVLDFAAETAWRSSQTGLQDVSWSPEGNLLLTRSRDGRSYLYQADGVLFDYAEYPLRWSPRNNRLLSGSAIWSLNDVMSASIVYVEGEAGADGRTRAEQVVEIYLPPGESPNPIHWSLSDPAFPDQYFVLLDWAPRMDWLLIGRGFGGSAAQQTAGFRLLALNARAGEILDSGLSVPASNAFAWHPAEPGVLVTTDLTDSNIGGMGKLTLWRIPDNETTRLPATTPHTLAPVWSPDGRYLAYSAFDLSGQFWLEVLDTQTGTAVKRADWGLWPAWNQDGDTLFYLERLPEEEIMRVRAIGREAGDPLTVVAIARPLRGPGLNHPQSIFDYLP